VPVIAKKSAMASQVQWHRNSRSWVAAIDVAGAGGTSWAKVKANGRKMRLSADWDDFADWGVANSASLVFAPPGRSS